MRPNTEQLKAVQLNDEQLPAVEAGAGAWAVVAGPGSGKTAALLARYRRLAALDSPQSILSLTFSKEAAAELRKRAGEIEKPVGRPCGFVTFHSLALSFCVQERERFPYELAAFPLASEGQSARFCGDASRKHRLKFRDLRSYISAQKRQRNRPDDSLRDAENDQQRSLAKAYAQYEEASRQAGVLDFDSLLLEMVETLERDPETHARWQYRWLMCDEAQDLDRLQWRLLQLLSQGNVWCVGDAAQCLYGFRGSHPELFLDFAALFPGAKTLYLSRNHRSTQELVGFLKQIGPVRELAEKFHTRNALGVPPVISGFLTDFEETAAVVNQLREYEPNACAVLARTNRILQGYENALSAAGIKYRLLGKSGYWAQPEIKAVLAYVQCAAAPFDNAVLSALRAPFAPSRFLKKKEICEGLKNLQAGSVGKPALSALLHTYRPADVKQHNALSSFASFLRGLNRFRDQAAGEAVRNIIAELRALEYYAEEEEAVDNSPVENLQQLASIAGRFASLADFLEHARKVSAASRAKKGVALATYHASKGLEFENVFLVSVAEGILPHKLGDLEEERRIWFVGASRAAERLFISYSGQPSRFLTPFLKPVTEPVRNADDSWLENLVGVAHA